MRSIGGEQLDAGDEAMSGEHVPLTRSGPAPRGSHDADPEPYPSNRYAWYCVFLLLFIYLNSFVDRTIISALVGPIKATMHLSDSQAGLLMGPAFAVFYTIAGLPLGWLADRMSRRALIGVGQLAWSLASGCFGLAGTFGQLFVARVGVGVGEASLGPSAYSLIADLFPPKKLARALSVYGMGISLGAALANLVVSALAKGFSPDKLITVPFFGERMGWQVIFLLTALPVLPLTLLLPTLREPKRRGIGMVRDAAGQARPMAVPMSMFLQYASQNRRALLCHCFGFAFLSFSGYGAGAWLPAFFTRVHHWSIAETTLKLGLAGLVIGTTGVLTGGWLADRLAARGYRDAKLRVGIFAALAWLPFGIMSPLMPTGNLAFFVGLPGSFLAAMPWGIAPAGIQELMPNQMRGQASGLYLFAINLLGLAGGPIVLALLTDYVFKNENQVHLSILWTTTIAHLASGALLFAGLAAYRKSRDNVDEWLRTHS